MLLYKLLKSLLYGKVAPGMHLKALFDKPADLIESPSQSSRPLDIISQTWLTTFVN